MNARTEGTRGQPAEPSSISSTLLERLKADDPEAWTRLVTLYGPVVYRWCRQAGVAEDDAPDLVQEVFAGVAQYVRSFRRDRPGDSFGAWLRAITRHRVSDHFRGRQGQLAAQGGSSVYEQFLNLAESEESSSPAAKVEKECWFSHRVLELVRAEFENRTWDAFWRIVVEGQSAAEVANAMGLGLPAVYQAKSRVLRRLRRELEGLEPD